MPENNKWILRPTGPSYTSFALLAVLIAWSTLLVQCTQGPIDTKKEATAPLQTTIRDGYTFQLFATPEQQLQYTRTWFSDPNEKRVALELLLERFPEAKTVRAEVELELAYLSLGVDYRFADSAAGLRAIEKYRQIALRYSDLPSICAKAHWYMGWIYADLLNKKPEAISHYQTIVKEYPDATLSLKPPVPWAGLVFPQAIEKPMAVYQYPTYKWSSIALLEIIRNSENEDEKWIAFEKLWTGDRSSLAMSYAFRSLVNDSPALSRKVAARADAYLEAGQVSQPIAQEIRIALKSLKSKEDAPSEQRAQKRQ
jgi:hypothetical protein